MSHQILRESEAIVVLGHPANRDANVSAGVRGLGLKMLKAAPDECNLIGIPDYQQFRYGIFRNFLSAFAWSSIYEKPTGNQNGGYPIKFTDFNPEEHNYEEIVIPVRPAPVTLAWSIDAADEAWESLEKGTAGTKIEGVSGQRKAIIFTPVNWFEYVGYQGRGLNPIATAPFGTTNPSALASFKAALVAVTSVVRAIRYPAFQDLEHESSFFVDTDPITNLADAEETIDMQIDGKTLPKTAPDVELPTGVLQVKHTEVLWQKIDYDGLPDACSFVDITDNLENLPPGGGLWFPYFEPLAKVDKTTVPTFLKEWVPLVFGSTRANTMSTLALVMAEWSINATTEAGKELSHITKVVDLALRTQARPIPCFRRKLYAGTVLLGVGYTIRFQDRYIRPTPQDMLHDAITGSDSHVAALKEIVEMVPADARQAIRSVTSMVDLHLELMKTRIKQDDVERIRTLAASLIFRDHNHWAPNSTNIQNALRILRLHDPIEVVAQTIGFPLHPAYLMSTDRTELVWSCFGGMAPSFRVPGGTKFDLAKEMTYRQKTGSGMSSRPLVRIYIRTKPIADAIADIKWVKMEKSIENPVTAPRAKESQAYIDKCFSGSAGIEMQSALRSFAEVALKTDKGKKRDRDDDTDDEGGSKRRRGDTTVEVDI